MLNDKIKNLVFDMGNVLLSFDTESVMTRLGIRKEEERRLFSRTIFESDVWQAYDRGTVEKDAFRPLVESLPAHLRDLAKEMLFDHIFAATYMPPIPQMETLIASACKQGYSMYLLSNAGQDFHIYHKGIPALRYFSGLFLSSDYKLLKPEPEIYERFFEKFSLNPKTCLFIDDLPANIEGAKRCGMDGIVFNAAKEDIAVLYEKLKEKGIFIERE